MPACRAQEPQRRNGAPSPGETGTLLLGPPPWAAPALPSGRSPAGQLRPPLSPSARPINLSFVPAGTPGRELRPCSQGRSCGEVGQEHVVPRRTLAERGLQAAEKGTFFPKTD